MLRTSSRVIAMAILMTASFVAQANGVVIETIEQTSAVNTFSGGGGNHGQSFTPTQTGYLSCVSFYMHDVEDPSTITVYEGTGAGGALLYTEPFTVIWPESEFLHVNLSTPVFVTGGQVYSVYSGAEFISGDVSDPYAGGDLLNTSGAVPNWDSAFRMVITAGGEPCDDAVSLGFDQPAIPTLSQWSLPGLALLLALAGWVFIRRARVAETV